MGRAQNFDFGPTIVPSTVGDGPLEYVAKAVHFNGASRLVNPSVAAVNSRYLLWSGWFKFVEPASYSVIWVSDPNTYVNGYWFNLGSPNESLAGYNGASGNYIAFPAENVQTAVWTHALVAVDVQGVAFAVYIDDINMNAVGQVSAGSPTVAALNGLPFYVGDDLFGAFYEGDMADLWINTGTDAIDESGNIPEEIRRKFITADGKPVFLGDDGELPTGVSPVVFLSGDETEFATNRGTGGAFTVEAGALAAASTSPSD